MTTFIVSMKMKADTEEAAAEEFLGIIAHYLGGIYTERPFDVAAAGSE